MAISNDKINIVEFELDLNINNLKGNYLHKQICNTD